MSSFFSRLPINVVYLFLAYLFSCLLLLSSNYFSCLPFLLSTYLFYLHITLTYKLLLPTHFYHVANFHTYFFSYLSTYFSYLPFSPWLPTTLLSYPSLCFASHFVFLQFEYFRCQAKLTPPTCINFLPP